MTSFMRPMVVVLSIALGSSLLSADNQIETKVENELLMPTLDLHGSMGMGYYSITQADPASTYNGLGLGYFFRPSLYAMSSISTGDYTIDTVTGFTIKPNASLLNQDLLGENIDGAVGFMLMDSASVNLNEWTISLTTPNMGKFEAGRSATASAKSALASFSPFHRLRGGYEDAVTALTTGTNVFPVYPLITYFGATGMLLDAPHISYTTPEINGLLLAAELAPSDYMGDIGGVRKHAYAFTAMYQKECGNLRYDARAAYANGVVNGYYPAFYNYLPLLVYGDQYNASLALGYKNWDASVSYGKETNSKNPQNNYLDIDYSNINPDILEGTLGYSFDNKYFGGTTSVQATYAVANSYFEYQSSNINSSKASMSGLALGQFVGNIALELRAQRYTTNNSSLEESFSGNIFSAGILYLF